MNVHLKQKKKEPPQLPLERGYKAKEQVKNMKHSQTLKHQPSPERWKQEVCKRCSTFCQETSLRLVFSSLTLGC